MQIIVNRVQSIRYRNPKKDLRLIAVTGDIGKTTTATILASILESQGKKVGLGTSLEFKAGKESEQNTDHTTINSPSSLLAFLKTLSAIEVDVAIVEIAPDDLGSGKFVGLSPDTLVVTNLDLDDDSEDRVAGICKSLSSDTKVILNRDDEASGYFLRYIEAANLMTYGENPEARVRIIKGSIAKTGSTAELDFNGTKINLSISILGQFNVYNCMAAAATALHLGIPIGSIEEGVGKTRDIKGQMEILKIKGNKTTVIIDNASSGKAFSSVLSTVRGMFDNGKLITVFGSPGGVDEDERAELGWAVAQHSDHMVITDQEPQDEDPLQIIRHIRGGVGSSQDINVIEEVNRKKAIEIALRMAKKSDVVLISGLGYQTYRQVKGSKYAWDDRDIVSSFFEDNFRKPSSPKSIKKKTTSKKSTKPKTQPKKAIVKKKNSTNSTKNTKKKTSTKKSASRKKK